MRAEVVAVGDELTSGQRLDTNSQWLSQQLALLGVCVDHHATVGDDLAAMGEVLQGACRRADLVVITGGLGPTADDLTRQALSQLLDRPLIQDDQVLDHIRELFARRGRVMPERNVIQSHFPEGTRPIPNPHGTAPGIEAAVPRPDGSVCVLYSLPGVPAEMTEMWRLSVVPAIEQRLGAQRRVIRVREIRCFGAGESEVESRLPDLVRRGQDPVVGITASQATITLRITAEGATDAECQAKIEPVVTTIYRCLGPLIFGEGAIELQDALVALLADTARTLATIEWGTAGLLADRLGSVAESEALYRGGLVIRDVGALADLLDVAAVTTEGLVVDPSDLVTQMAHAIRSRFDTDYGLAIGPFPPSEHNHLASASVFVAVAGREQAICEQFGFAAHPAIQRERTAKQALNLARLSLLEHRV